MTAKPKKPAKPTAKREPGHNKGAMDARIIAFVEAYFANGQNGRQAALAAGYSEKGADVQAWRLLKNVKVLQRIEDRQKALAQKFELTTENVLKSLAQAVYFDPRKLFDAAGKLLEVRDMDTDTAMALSSFEVFEEFEGTGKARRFVGLTKKVKWLDKNVARDQANKILGQYREDNRQSQPQTRVVMMPAKDRA